MSLGLYLHIPFCQAICDYCNFNRGLFDGPLKTRYVSALAREIGQGGGESAGSKADTIFFGGGTPSLLDPTEVATLIAACRDAHDVSPEAEVTLETNPETATLERLIGFREAGVNRLSLGVQSFDDAELKRLGRVHDASRAAAAVGVARAAGFDNVSVDLMCWLPGQSRTSWLATVNRTIDLAPDHVSVYLLELYPNAPLKETMARRAPDSGGVSTPGWTQVDDDEAADMYLEGLAALDAAGYAQYEISNVARPGRESRHNLKYWTMGDWRGCGCGAHSTVVGERWQNVASTADYVDRVQAGERIDVGRRTLSPAERAGEALFTGLRLMSGLDADELYARYGVGVWESYGENLAHWTEGGFMWRHGSRFGLTRTGMLVSNDILASFV